MPCFYSLAHLAVPYGGWQDVRLEPRVHTECVTMQGRSGGYLKQGCHAVHGKPPPSPPASAAPLTKMAVDRGRGYKTPWWTEGSMTFLHHNSTCMAIHASINGLRITCLTQGAITLSLISFRHARIQKHKMARCRASTTLRPYERPMHV
jgi:hypothetical protein